MDKILWFLTSIILLFASVEGFFFVTPEPKTCVIVGGAVSLECGTYNDGYTLTFVFVAPPGHFVSNPPIFSEDLPGGGRKINTTFIVTKELNTTTVRCVAIGSTYEQTNPEPMYAYELPDGTRNNKVCQLANYIFVTWDPIFAPPGIGLTFRITDNMGLNYITSDLYHSFSYTAKNYSGYNASVTVIVNATAANQIGYSNSTNISKTLNGTIPLTVGYRCDNNEGNWACVFHTKLDHLDLNECSINNETLKDAMIVSCNEEQCVNNSGNVTISKNEIISTNSLPAKRKYNHILCFNYLGRQIISQPLETSTHDVQDIEYLSQNDTSLCLRFHLIDHREIQSIHLHVERGSELLLFNVTVPNKIFEWCASTIPPTSSSNNGNWSLFACDGPGHICTNPAVVLENIMLNINTATTHNTIATYTTHTITRSLSHATSIVSFSSPSPSSTLSSTVNLTVPVIVPVLVPVFLVLVIAMVLVIIVVLAKSSPKKD
ncbi:PREDICTED: uncharacterized protein LOC109583744 [Amphimedon queenslandica]|uniref:Fibronectin type-III domain-containing protein n=1 Tax=Amphimedon queenslandica TaxID=400682 RepID=A0AAN0JDB7_AMPQE|nr:PREDICTED: uncharacterized protein LOC109583744 [Amphimedon queenslandica]|eukprot:XP_019854746.1 PREDICTED: uncharacterized protein LOC109583744 [Amphimedon queenslandica]